MSNHTILPDVPEVEHNEEIKEVVPVPDETAVNPQGIITTSRKTPIKRYNAVVLNETHGMTTEANRFRTE